MNACAHVSLQIHRIRKSLEAPYTGPFLAYKRYPKVFVIENFAGIQQIVSIDRLKPALIKDAAVNSPPSTPASTSPSSIDEDVIVEYNGEEEEIEEAIIEYIPIPNTAPRQIETRLGKKITVARNR